MSDAVLNITNGDCAVATLTQAALPGDWLPWRDVLHDGPVPAGLDLTALSRERARFIAERGWASPEQVLADFAARDRRLDDAPSCDRIRLWFEHDLYDQLQLLQVLDGLATRQASAGKLTLLCIDDYLGTASPDTIQRYLAAESAVTPEQLALAQRAWQAFRAPTPQAWANLLREDTRALPFLEGAIRRLLEEYPQPRTGLSRTAYHALSLAGQGEERFNDLFQEYQLTEERRFMGDLSFRWLLHQMSVGDAALLTVDSGLPPHEIDPDQRFQLTDRGREVLAGRRSAGDLLVRDRWIGGVRLRPAHYWTWDVATDALTESVATTA